MIPKTSLKKSDRISPAILQTELHSLARLNGERNYGNAEELIAQITARLINYDWAKIREAEKIS